MKNILFLLFIFLSFAVACTFKASPAVTDSLIPKESAVNTDASVVQAGETIFTTKCTQCHHAKSKKVSKTTYEKLRPILGAMVQKAKLNSDEIAQVSAYVHANAKK